MTCGSNALLMLADLCSRRLGELDPPLFRLMGSKDAGDLPHSLVRRMPHQLHMPIGVISVAAFVAVRIDVVDLDTEQHGTLQLVRIKLGNAHVRIGEETARPQIAHLRRALAGPGPVLLANEDGSCPASLTPHARDVLRARDLRDTHLVLFGPGQRTLPSTAWFWYKR